MPDQTPSIRERLTEPIDGLWLALFRIGFGACMLWQVWWYFSTDNIHTYYIAPGHHFTWYGFDWVKPWDGAGMYLHFYVLGIAAACIMLGFYYRTACFVFWLGFSYAFLIDKSWYLNHYYLICLLAFIGIFLPANRQLSIDAWLKPKLARRTVPAWALWLVRFQLGVPYFYGGLAKLNRDWIMGEPMRLWLSEKEHYPVLGKFCREEWCVHAFGWGGMLLDLFLIPCLLWKPTRIPAMIAMVSFHLLNTWLFDIGVFPWLMLIATLVVFTPHETLGRLRSLFGDNGSSTAPPKEGFPKPLGLLLGVFVCWQILMPLRHHFYKGDTSMTRQGHHFSWRMKLNDRFFGKLQFFAVNPRNGEEIPLPLNRTLTLAQEMEFRDPDQMLLTAQWLKNRLPKVKPPMEVHADVRIGVNTREPTQFVDRDLNLLDIRRTFGPGDWFSLYLDPVWITPRQQSEDGDSPALATEPEGGDER